MVYRWLLRLLPRRRRAAYGDEMRDVFAMTMAASRGRGKRRVLALWCREVIGMVKFAWRERFGASGPLGAGPVGRDVRSAWRGVRGRGWRAVFVVMLFGVALAANTVVFSAADAFVFRTVPYDRPDQLVVIERAAGMSAPSDYARPHAIFEWRKHADLFAGMQAHDRGGSAYLTEAGVTEPVRAQRITPGLLELLGVMPVYGRPFVAADAEQGADPRVIISESLARRLFGTAGNAVGQSFYSGTDTPTVIGVMPASFRFPSAVEEIWRPMKLEDGAPNVGVRHVARLQPGWSIESASVAVRDRLPAVAAAVPEQVGRSLSRDIEDQALSLRTMADFRRHQGATAIFSILVGAAVCLLLIACANVASLELAASAERVRTAAVRTALGAPRASLIRTGLLEGAVLLGASAAVAMLLAYWGLEVLSAQLTAAMREALANPLDLDPRVIGFMAPVAAGAWLLTTLPSAISVSRLSVVDGLRHDSRTMPSSRGATRSRQWLMTAQVALTVVLLVGSLLFIRTYDARIGATKASTRAPSARSACLWHQTRDLNPPTSNRMLRRVCGHCPESCHSRAPGRCRHRHNLADGVPCGLPDVRVTSAGPWCLRTVSIPNTSPRWESQSFRADCSMPQRQEKRSSSTNDSRASTGPTDPHWGPVTGLAARAAAVSTNTWWWA